MKIIKQEQYNESAIRLAAKVLAEGGVIAYPTDTIYGLGALATNDEAVHKIYQIKQRDRDKPMLMIVGSREQAEQYAAIPEKFKDFVNQHWPGPVSLVLPAKSADLAAPLSRWGTVAFRLPADKFVRNLALLAGGPIVSTSLNRSGWPPIATPAEAMENLPAGKIDLALDMGPVFGHPSSLYDLSGDEIKLIRQ